MRKFLFFVIGLAVLLVAAASRTNAGFGTWNSETIEIKRYRTGPRACLREAASAKAGRARGPVGRLEHYPAKWNHLTGMIFGGGEARFAWRCHASAKKCNDATAKKHPACGGANRFPGFVAALARYRASRCTPRLPGKPICRHQIDSIWLDHALRMLSANAELRYSAAGSIRMPSGATAPSRVRISFSTTTLPSAMNRTASG